MFIYMVPKVIVQLVLLVKNYTFLCNLLLFNGEVAKSSPVIDDKVYLRIFHPIKEFIVRISLVNELLDLIYKFFGV